MPIRGTQCWQWLGLMGGSVFVSPPASSPPGCRRRQPGGDQFPSPANLIDANRPRGLTRDTPTPPPEPGPQKRLPGSSPNHLRSKRKIQALTRLIQAQSSRSSTPFGAFHALLWRGSPRPSASGSRCRRRLLLSPIGSASGGTMTGSRLFWCRTNRCAWQISTDRCAQQSSTDRCAQQSSTSSWPPELEAAEATHVFCAKKV
ncbi:hypothetical protein OGCDGJMD_01560 [Cyanobium usitatum str. Tous]|nr:hypothetical protein OGCDGJMD_01560 [Cyanobium usitatum str. Tous]